VEFTLGKDAFQIYGLDMKPVVESGDFTIEVGASSNDIKLKEKITL